MNKLPPPASFRIVLGTIIGVAVGLLSPRSWGWEPRALLGWAAFCLTNLAILFPLLSFSGEQTRSLAVREDESRSLAATLTTSACVVSLVGAFLTLYQAGQAKGVAAYALIALTLFTVTLSWLLVHSQYALHYARRFYTDEAGVQFTQPDSKDPLPNPTYLEFIYLSLTIGMTFQVSDMILETAAMRRLLLIHCLLAYGFNTVIIAVTINAAASLVS